KALLLDRALSDYDSALQQKPDSTYEAKLRTDRAEARQLLEQPDWAGVVEDYTKTLSLRPDVRPDDWDLYAKLGYAHEKSGDKEEAVKNYVEAAQHYANGAAAAPGAKVFEWRRKARELFQNAIALDPMNRSALAGRAQVLTAFRDWTLAAEAYEALV